MKRSMLGTYCTIWSQQNPTASLGKTLVGSNALKEHRGRLCATRLRTRGGLIPVGVAFGGTGTWDAADTGRGESQSLVRVESNPNPNCTPTQLRLQRYLVSSGATARDRWSRERR